MSDKQVTVDVHEIMQHLRAVGASASFVLNGDGSGSLYSDGGPTMRWSNFPEFVHKWRGLGRQSAVQRVVLAAQAKVKTMNADDYGSWVDVTRDLFDTVHALGHLGASDD